MGRRRKDGTMPLPPKPAGMREREQACGTQMMESLIPEEVLRENPPLSPESREEIMTVRRKLSFTRNRGRIQSLLSPDCSITDIENALKDLPQAEVSINPKLVYSLDGGFTKLVDDAKLEHGDNIETLLKTVFMRGIERGLAASKQDSPTENLRTQILAAQKLISVLIQDTEQFISVVESLTLAEVIEKITFYFNKCEEKKISYTVPGLAYEIGFVHRQHLLDFIKEKQDSLVGYVIARALMKIEEQRNMEIISGNGIMAGHKLDLATNFDWNDAKQKSTKEESKSSPQLTQNIVNYNSLPPATITVEDWEKTYISKAKEKLVVGGSDSKSKSGKRPYNRKVKNNNLPNETVNKP